MILSEFIKQEEYSSKKWIEIFPEGCNCIFYGDIDKIPEDLLSCEVVDVGRGYFVGLLTVYIPGPTK